VRGDEIFFASRPYAEGILEAIELYGFFDNCDTPTT
jgi:sucrose-phosphate synthase